MDSITVSSTEFQNNVGKYLEASLKGPVYITKHDRPVSVILDIDAYEGNKSSADVNTKQLIEESIQEHIETLKQLADR